MRILTVPNWSFGRDRRLLSFASETIQDAQLDLHFCEGDVDHNRTVTAFSGDVGPVMATLFELASEVLPSIDLNRHTGVHPRIGALDVCPFIGTNSESLRDQIEGFAAEFAERFEVPVFLYEKSERGSHATDLPSLRKGGFGSLLERELRPDFGPNRAHPLWGVTVVGLRGFLVAMNVNLKVEDPKVALEIAKQIRKARSAGDARFLGVRALGFPLQSRGLSQVSLNLTLPDLVSIDEIIEWVWEGANRYGVQVSDTELIGVIRPRDMERAEWLKPNPAQVVEF